jgi:hypothetical protein
MSSCFAKLADGCSRYLLEKYVGYDGLGKFDNAKIDINRYISLDPSINAEI